MKQPLKLSASGQLVDGWHYCRPSRATPGREGFHGIAVVWVFRNIRADVFFKAQSETSIKQLEKPVPPSILLPMQSVEIFR